MQGRKRKSYCKPVLSFPDANMFEESNYSAPVHMLIKILQNFPTIKGRNK